MRRRKLLIWLELLTLLTLVRAQLLKNLRQRVHGKMRCVDGGIRQPAQRFQQIFTLDR